MATIYDHICEIIDRVKADDDSLDTDAYAGMIVDAIGLHTYSAAESAPSVCGICGETEDHVDHV